MAEIELGDRASIQQDGYALQAKLAELERSRNSVTPGTLLSARICEEIGVLRMKLALVNARLGEIHRLGLDDFSGLGLGDDSDPENEEGADFENLRCPSSSSQPGVPTPSSARGKGWEEVRQIGAEKIAEAPNFKKKVKHLSVQAQVIRGLLKPDEIREIRKKIGEMEKERSSLPPGSKRLDTLSEKIGSLKEKHRIAVEAVDSGEAIDSGKKSRRVLINEDPEIQNYIRETSVETDSREKLRASVPLLEPEFCDMDMVQSCTLPVWRQRLLDFVSSVPFAVSVALLIITDLVFALILLLSDVNEDERLSLMTGSNIILGFLTFEVVLRIIAHGKRFFQGERAYWNMFELFVVIVSLVVVAAEIIFSKLPSGGSVAPLRVLRGARLSKLLRAYRCLRLFFMPGRLVYARAGLVNSMQHAVRQSRRDLLDQQFDLDLSYVTKNIIAMSMPAPKGSLDSWFRNSATEVCRFLDERHLGNYIVLNLAKEITYPADLFHGKVARIAFDDHSVPSFQALLDTVELLQQHLQNNPSNVAAVHCKGGKGRTGVVICAYLCFQVSEAGKDSDEAATVAELSLAEFKKRRTKEGLKKAQGVETASQVRWVHYWSTICSQIKRSGGDRPLELGPTDHLKFRGHCLLPHFPQRRLCQLDVVGLDRHDGKLPVRQSVLPKSFMTSRASFMTSRASESAVKTPPELPFWFLVRKHHGGEEEHPLVRDSRIPDNGVVHETSGLEATTKCIVTWEDIALNFVGEILIEVWTDQGMAFSVWLHSGFLHAKQLFPHQIDVADLGNGRTCWTMGVEDVDRARGKQKMPTKLPQDLEVKIVCDVA